MSCKGLVAEMRKELVVYWSMLLCPKHVEFRMTQDRTFPEPNSLLLEATTVDKTSKKWSNSLLTY